MKRMSESEKHQRMLMIIVCLLGLILLPVVWYAGEPVENVNQEVKEESHKKAERNGASSDYPTEHIPRCWIIFDDGTVHWSDVILSNCIVNAV